MRIHQQRQCITLACILLLLDTDVTYSPHLTHSALHTNKGKGKGQNKSRPLVLKHVNVVAQVRRNPNLVKQHLHISLEVFDLLVLDLQPFKKHLTANSSLKSVTFYMHWVKEVLDDATASREVTNVFLAAKYTSKDAVSELTEEDLQDIEVHLERPFTRAEKKKLTIASNRL